MNPQVLLLSVLGSTVIAQFGAIAGMPRYRMIQAFRLSSTKRYTKDFTPPVTFEKDAATTALLDFSQRTGSTVLDVTGKGHDGNIAAGRWMAAP